MRSIRGRKGWPAVFPAVAAAVLMAGLQVLVSSPFTPALAGYELPPGERITNLPPIPRNIPQKEAYEAYDPVIGRNFDLKNFWLRADLRVRPEMRNGMCFGNGNPTAGACNTLANARANANPSNTGSGNTFFVQQWVRLGIGYDLSPDVNFYMELLYASDWGTNANPSQSGAAGGPALNNNCNTVQVGQCTLGVRAAYVLIRNLGGVQGLSMKAGRQYLIFGNHSLFGHFDWANTGFSHDGILFQYSTKAVDAYFGWFREADMNITQAAAVGGVGGAVAGTKANNAADMFLLYTQIKSVPGFLFEPHYILYTNFTNNQQTPVVGAPTAAALTTNPGGTVGGWTGAALPKANLQIRNTIGNRTEMRKGNWDVINEIEYQFGRQASGNNGTNMDLHINAWATRNWIGYTVYEHRWKPRLAVGLDYASGDGNANCSANNAAGTAGRQCRTSNTFENFYPTNHIHMAYMDVMAWRNMFSPQVNFQFRPSERDHFEIWYANFNLANTKDNWYRAAQTPYVWTKANNNQRHIGDEVDFTWTRMFADGKVALQGTWGHLFTGAYIRDNLASNADQDWWYLSLWMNF